MNCFNIRMLATAVLWTLLVSVASAEEPIRSVTVFENRARVTRVRTVNLEPGVTEVSFEGLAASLRSASVAAVMPGAEVLGIRLKWKHHEVDVRDRVEKLEQQLREKNKEKFRLEQEFQIASKMNSLVAGYASHLETTLRDFGATGDWSGQAGSILEAESAVAEWGIESADELDELGRRGLELSREMQKIQYDLNKLRSTRGHYTRTAIVLVEATSAHSGDIELAYDVPEASWTPVYEARLDETNARVEWQMNAQLRQKSGEDWSDVRLTLSTARSSLGLKAPTLYPMEIAGYANAPKSSATVASRALDESAKSAEEPMPGSSGEAADDLSQAVVRSDRGPATFEIRTAASIPSDGQAHQVPVFTGSFEATLGFEAVPRLRPHVYRRARFKNDSAVPMLPGLVHVFREGAFVGDTHIDAVAPGELMKLYFGVEGRITARRHEIERKSEDAGTFTSDRLITIGYRYELQSFMGQPVDVYLVDALPVSEIEGITVTLTRRTQPTPQVSARDGALEWKLELRQGEQKTVNLEYTVRHPADDPLAPGWFD